MIGSPPTQIFYRAPLTLVSIVTQIREVFCRHLNLAFPFESDESVLNPTPKNVQGWNGFRLKLLVVSFRLQIRAIQKYI